MDQLSLKTSSMCTASRTSSARVSPVVVAIGVLLAVGSSPAAAQKLEVGGHYSGLRLSEFDTTDLGRRHDIGIGFDVTGSPIGRLALDGGLTVFAGDLQLRRVDEFWHRSRLLGLMGLRGEHTVGHLEAYARGRVGFLHFWGGDDVPRGDRETRMIGLISDQVFCTPIVPTPLGCRLAAGYTAFAADLGAGVSVALNPRSRVRLRLEASDLLVRYNLEATRPSGEITDGFTSHNLLVTIGIGWRF